MKILLLTYEYLPFHGGVATYLSNLMKAAPTNVEVVIDVPKDGEHWIATAWRQFFKVRKARPDLIAISHVLPAGYVAFKINFWFKTPYLVFTHGTDILTARRNGWKHFWLRFILRHAKYVIANSRFTASLLIEEGITGVEIVPPGVEIVPQTAFHEPRAGIISVGRLVPRKGFDVLLKALPVVIKKNPTAHLTIIGNGAYYDELVRLAHELRIETFVDILTDIEDKTKYWRRAALFVLAAREDGPNIEGFGIVTLEAAMQYLPVVVSSSGGAPEAVINGLTGLIVPPNDPAALAEAILFILNDPAKAQKMGEAGRKYVIDEYSIPVIAKKFWKIIQSSPCPPLSRERDDDSELPSLEKEG
jgi:phosphatidylinositol alpha-1,6-mannosyltransferase